MPDHTQRNINDVLLWNISITFQIQCMKNYNFQQQTTDGYFMDGTYA